jgi:hypothetical protein
LSQNYPAFVAFCNNAHFEDAGESASKKHLRVPLGTLVGNFLGEKNWAPRGETKNL